MKNGLKCMVSACLCGKLVWWVYGSFQDILGSAKVTGLQKKDGNFPQSLKMQITQGRVTS